jgi:hypothetical protein
VFVASVNTTSSPAIPRWLSFDNASRALVGVPSVDDFGVVQLVVWAAAGNNARVSSPQERLYITVTEFDSINAPTIVANLTLTLLLQDRVTSTLPARARRQTSNVSNTPPNACSTQPDGFHRYALVTAMASSVDVDPSEVVLLSASSAVASSSGTCEFDAVMGASVACDSVKDSLTSFEENGTTAMETSLNDANGLYGTSRYREQVSVSATSVDLESCEDLDLGAVPGRTAGSNDFQKWFVAPLSLPLSPSLSFSFCFSSSLSLSSLTQHLASSPAFSSLWQPSTPSC